MIDSDYSVKSIGSPLRAENALSVKISEDPFSLIFSLTEKAAQCRFMIVSSCYL